MACLDFLRNARHKFTVCSFNHDTEYGNRAEKFVKEYCEKIGQPVVFGKLSGTKPKKESQEEFWRNARLKFFASLPQINQQCFDSQPVITAHHLDDVCETWVFTALNGNPKTIPYYNGGFNGASVYRPFLLTTKQELKGWALARRVPWIEDESNADVHHARNRIRHRIIPEALLINPGLHKVVARKVQEEYDVCNPKNIG